MHTNGSFRQHCCTLPRFLYRPQHCGPLGAVVMASGTTSLVYQTHSSKDDTRRARSCEKKNSIALHNGRGYLETLRRVISRHVEGTNSRCTNAESSWETCCLYTSDTSRTNTVNYRCGYCCPYTGYGGLLPYCCCVRA